MSSRSSVVVARDGGERSFPEEALPLSLGGGYADEVQLAGAAPGAAQIGFLEARPFVQSGKSGGRVLVNDEPITGTRRLADGDVIRVGGVEIACRVDGSGLRLSLEGNASGGAAAEPGVEGEEIVPIAFQPVGPIEEEPPPSGPSGRAIAIGVGALLLVAMAWFSFTSVSVGIDLVPAADDVKLRGTWLSLELGGRFLVRPGRHTVVAEKEGWFPLEAEIEVSDAPDQDFSFELKKRPGLLFVETAPVTGAPVSVDGEPVGETPLAGLELESGPHRVEIEAPERYLDWAADVEIEGAGAEQTLAVELTPAWAEISVRSIPPGAAISVDGEEVATTDATFELMAGEYRIEARLDGYAPWSSRLVVEANTPQTLPEIVLALADGKLSLTSVPPGAEVTVGTEFRGRTPVTLALASGETHEIGLFKAGYARATRTVELEPSGEQELSVELEAQLGVVRVSSHPGDAVLWVDGKKVGPADRELKLVAVPHRLEIEKAGYRTHRVTITPTPGFPQRVDVRLQTPAEYKAATTPARIETKRGQKLQRVGGGRFEMGSSRREKGRRANEAQHTVELTRPYYLGVAEITNEQFRAFEPGHSSGLYEGLSLDVDELPVARVSWEQAARFCNWLSHQDGLPPAYVEKNGALVAAEPMTTGYRLPTEAEFVWAMRQGLGGKGRYPWGDVMPPPAGSGNYADVTASGVVATTLTTYHDGYAVAAPVARQKPNSLGIYDLGGNVAEWMHDFYAIAPPGGSAAVRDPMGPREGRYRVIRGSSWKDGSVSELRLAYRDYGEKKREDVGFRIARYVE